MPKTIVSRTLEKIHKLFTNRIAIRSYSVSFICVKNSQTLPFLKRWLFTIATSIVLTPIVTLPTLASTIEASNIDARLVGHPFKSSAEQYNGNAIQLFINTSPSPPANSVYQSNYSDFTDDVHVEVLAEYDDDIDGEVDQQALEDDWVISEQASSDYADNAAFQEGVDSYYLPELPQDDQVFDEDVSTAIGAYDAGELYDDGLNIGSDYVTLNAISPETIATFVEIVDIVRNEYVRPVNDEALFQYAIVGMLEKLDSHAEYLMPDSYEKLRNFTDGEIAQVGMSAIYDKVKSSWLVSAIDRNSAAEKSNIKIGDKLLAIKQIELAPDMTPQDIEQLLSGIAGSQVSITVKDKKGVVRSLVLQRTLTVNNELDITVQQGIAIIRLPVFQNNSKDQLLDLLRMEETPISGIVLDIRNNPGGVLSSAIDIASLFIADKGLIQVRNRTNSSQILNPNGSPYLSSLPVVVLQNKYSASAAEVLSSSLQTNDRATVIGETSFGKGTVQEVIPLQTGGAVKLTVAEYRSVKGEPINGVGVKPDVTLKHDGSDWQQEALRVLLAQNRPLVLNIAETLDKITTEEDY